MMLFNTPEGEAGLGVADSKTALQAGSSALRRQLVIAGLVGTLLLFHLITAGRFLTVSNVRAVASHAVIPTFLTWGFCFIMTAGVMDLSAGAVLILAANVAGLMGLRFGYSGLVFGALATTLLLEFINAECFLRLRVPSWISSLGMAMVYEASGAIYSASRVRTGMQVVDLGDKARLLGTAPYNLILMAVGLLLAYLLYNRTAIGLNVRAVGSNEMVSKMMGVNPARSKLLGTLAGGVFIGLAAAINESYAGRVMPVTGLTSVALVFEPLAAFLLAQALEDVFNLTVGALIGAFSVSALFNVLTILGVPSGTWQEVVLGASVILVAAVSQKGKGGIVK